MAYTSIDGHVTRTHPKFISVEETITIADGRSFPRYWQCWVERNNIPEGSIVNVKGNLSTKIAKDYNTGEDKLSKKGERLVEHTLNDCTVTVLKAPGTETQEFGTPIEQPSANAPF